MIDHQPSGTTHRIQSELLNGQWQDGGTVYGGDSFERSYERLLTDLHDQQRRSPGMTFRVRTVVTTDLAASVVLASRYRVLPTPCGDDGGWRVWDQQTSRVPFASECLAEARAVAAALNSVQL